MRREAAERATPNKALEPTAAQPRERYAAPAGWRRINARPLIWLQALRYAVCVFRKENVMPQTAIFGPVFGTVFLTLLVLVYMYIRRISFLTRNKVNPRDMAVPGALAQI